MIEKPILKQFEEHLSGFVTCGEADRRKFELYKAVLKLLKDQEVRCNELAERVDELEEELERYRRYEEDRII